MLRIPDKLQIEPETKLQFSSALRSLVPPGWVNFGLNRWPKLPFFSRHAHPTARSTGTISYFS